jgi:hypothetical protein
MRTCVVSVATRTEGRAATSAPFKGDDDDECDDEQQRGIAALLKKALTNKRAVNVGVQTKKEGARRRRLFAQ